MICVEIDALAIVDATLERPSIVGGASIYPFVQNILLGLRAEELGASFTTLLTAAEPADPRAARHSRRSRGRRPHLASAIAPTRGRSKLARNPVSEFAFGERFGEPWS